jgi:polysulfide reductase chain C
MYFVEQNAWHGLIAAYLFLGGLGGGIMALGAWADLFLQPNDGEADRRPGLFAAWAGVAALGIGSLILVLDLKQPLKAIYALSNFSSWITWGVLFLSLYFVAAAVYLWPYVIGRQRAASGIQKVAGVSAAVLGLLVAVYTGFLLSSSTGISFWNTPALPLLFVVSGLSTGAALLMLYLVLIRQRSPFAARLLGLLERIDLGLVAVELLILFAFLNMAWAGNAGSKVAAQFLLGSAGFMIGVPVVGLALPLALEAFSMRKHAVAPTVVASLAVLAGGALLRVYLLQAGFWAFPWPR